MRDRRRERGGKAPTFSRQLPPQFCLLGGLGSGEALIESLGKEDGRRLVLESEFARLLAVVARDGSTLSAIFRQCWDTGRADVTTRQNELHVTDAHLSVLAHVTRDELLRRLGDLELGNGFGNRFLWVCARRSQELPFGGEAIHLGDIPERLRNAADNARKLGNSRLDFDQSAKNVWRAVYHDLSEGLPGLLGAVTGRAEAHVVRLALIYALLDLSQAIGEQHLKAALAVWDYCAASAKYIWGDALGDPTADEILRSLRSSTDGLTRWELTNHFGRNKAKAELDRAIAVLAERRMIRSETEDTGGRSSTRYRAV